MLRRLPKHLQNLAAISLFFFVLISPALSVRGQEEAPKKTGELLIPDTQAATEITLESVTAALAEAQASTDLDEATKASVVQLYTSAQKLLETARQAADKKAEYEKAVQDAPAQLAAAKEQNQVNRNLPPPNFRDQTPDQLKQLLVQKQAELVEVKKQATSLESEPARRLQRTGELPKLIEELEQKLAENKRQMEMAAPPNEVAAVTRARTTRLAAERRQLTREQEKLKAEQVMYKVTSEALPILLENATLKAAQIQKEIDAVQRLLTQNQKNQVDQIIDKTREDLAQAGELLKPLAERNVALAQLQKAYIDKNTSNQLRLTKVRETITEVDRLQKVTSERLAAVGLTDALSVTINQQRVKLLKLKYENQPDPELKTDLTAMQIESFDMQDESADLATETTLPELVQRLEDAGAPNLEAQKEVARSVLFQKRKLLTDVASANETLLNTLSALDSEQRILAKKIDDFIGFIDQRIVWIRSAAPLGLADIKPGWEAANWLVTPSGWMAAWQEIKQDVLSEYMTYGPAMLGLLLLFAMHGRFKRLLTESSEMAVKGRCSTIKPTWNTVLATVLLALPWPFVLMLLGTMLGDEQSDSEFAASLGRGLLRTSYFLMPLEILRHTCRRGGLGENHFDWSNRVLKLVREKLRWYYIVAVPTLTALWALESQTNEEWKNSLGRLCAILFFLATMVLMHLIWKPDGVFFSQVAMRNRNSKIYRFRVVWYLAMLLVPFSLFMLSLTGYHYTSIILTTGFKNTVNVAIFLVLTGGVLLRWLLVRRRHIAIEEAKRLRAQAAANASSSEGAPPQSEVSGINVIEQQPLIDMASVNRQAQEVVVFALSAVGAVWLLWIWRDALPAVEFLEQKELWSVAIGEKIEVVSYRDVLFASGSFFLTFLMIKNMPGLLNLAAQTYSTMDSGTRYAATTIFRYIITIIGVIIGLSFLSIPWSQYSWLVAAATVGIGFGLQEIVANFVSGLILLLERPVRVGDWITIDDTTGVVTRIQMRATTVTNWDNQELIVPNKDLITGKLLNWTLSSVTTRLVLHVGVAYGSDVDRVRAVLLEVVRGHADVLKTPEPSVILEEFADSSLNFVIRCHLATVEKRMLVRHDINQAIERAFRRENITIPFPQRDLHIIAAESQGTTAAPKNPDPGTAS